MIYTKIYIGSDNVSKVLDVERIHALLLKYTEGYTLTRATCSWKGSREDVAIVEVYSDIFDAMDFVAEAKITLRQDSIMVVSSNVDVTF